MDEIIKQCKCGIYLTINKHRNYYESAQNAIDEINEMGKNNNGHHDNYEPEISAELSERMNKEDQIFELQFYPNTPIGFYIVYGSSLDEVIQKAIKCLKDN